VSLVERWNHLESGLEPSWTDAALTLEIVDAEARSRAAALLGPVGPGFSGSTIRLTVSTRGGVGSDGLRRLLKRIDGEGIPGRLELVNSSAMSTASTTVPAPATARRKLADAWRAALAVLPGDWSDALVELELDSSADVDRAAVLCAPLNPIRWGERAGFRLRCASSRGYGASTGMVSRCLGRLDDDGITGRVRIARVLSDVDPVGTQGAVFSIGRRPG